MPKQINVKLGFEADTSQAKKQIQDLQKSLDSLMTSSTKNTALGDFSKGMVEAQQSAVKLKSILGESMNVDTGRLDLVKFNQQLQDSGLTLSKLGSQLSSLGPEGRQAFLSLADSIVTAQKPMVETNRLLDGMWTALKNTARWQLSSSILHGFMSSLQGAYGYAQDLNASLNSIRIVSGQSVEQMARFADQANRSAQALSTSTLAYTDAALIFYQQGLTGDAVTERVDTVLKLSNVTGDSAEQVSSYMTAIWNNFYDGSESLESFADKITALGAATASSSAEIASGLQQFAAIGNTVGLSYDYAATALATIVAQTRQSESTVGNGLRTIFARLSSLKQGGTDEDGTDLTKYTKALAEYGIQVKDENNNLKEMDQILEEIGAKWQTLSDTQKVALAQTVGGVRQYATIMALFDNWDQFQKNLTVTQGAEGTLQEQADIYAQSWEAARKRVQAAWQAIYQDLIDDKFFITILNGLAEILKGVDYLIDRIGGLKGVLATVGIAVTQLFSKQIETGIKNTVTNLNKIFYGDKIQAALAQQAVKAAKEQLTYKKEDVANDTIIENQILQIELNEKIRQRKLQINDADKEYYQSLLKTSGELAKQNALLADRQLASNKDLADTEEGMLYKLYNSPKVNSGSPVEKRWTEILNNQDSKFDDLVLKTKDDQGNIDSSAIQHIIDLYGKEAREIGFTDEELKKLIQTRRENLLLTKQSGEEAQKQAVFDAAITAIIGQGVNSEEAYVQAIQDRINALAQESGISAERLQAIEQDVQKTDAQTENYSEQEKQILNLIKAKQALNNEDENGELHQYIKKKTDPNPEQNPSRIGIQINTDNIVKAAQGISQITMGISGLTTAIKTFGDKSISVTERFTNGIMSATMALPGLITGISSLAAVLGISVGWMTAIVVAVMGLIWAFKELQKNTPEGRLAELNNKLDEQKQKVAELKSEYDKLSSALGNYKNKLEEINKLEGPQKAAAIAEYNAEVLELIQSLDNYQDIIGNIKFTKDGLIDLSEDDITKILNAKSIQYVNEQLETANTNIETLKAHLDVDNSKYNGARILARGNYASKEVYDSMTNSQRAAWGEDITLDIRKAFGDHGVTTTSSKEDQRDALQDLVEANKIKEEDIDRIIWAIEQLSDEEAKNFDDYSNAAKTQAQIDAQTEANQRLALSPSEEFGNLTDESQQEVLDELNKLDIDKLKELYGILTENPNIPLIDALKQVGAEVDNLNLKIDETKKIGHDLPLHANVEDLNNYKGEQEDLNKDIAEMSDYIQDNLEYLPEFSRHLEECRDETERISYAIIRFDDAIQDVAENYDDWMDALKSPAIQDDLIAVKGLTTAYENLLDLDTTSEQIKLSDAFLRNTKNLELMKEAAEGSADAYDKLANVAVVDILTNQFGQTSDQAWAMVNDVDAAMNALEAALGRPLQVGENIDFQSIGGKAWEAQQDLEAALNAMLLTIGDDLNAANSMMAQFGYDGELEQYDVNAENEQKLNDIVAEPGESITIDAPEIASPGGGLISQVAAGLNTVQRTFQGVNYVLRPHTATDEQKTTAFAYRVKPGTVHKSIGGDIKYKHSSHGGGSKNPSNSGGSGGSKGSQPKKKTVKEHKKPEKKEDRYHDIKERIEDLNTELKRLAKTEDRVYGKSKLKYMDQEIEKLEKQIKLTDEYIKEIKEYAAIDQANLRGINMGATFDENGRLNNYEQVLANIVNTYNGAVAAYNSAVDNFNASAQEDADSAALEAAEKTLSAAKETYDERLKILDQYEDTYNLLQQKMDERIDQVWELFDKRLEKITWRIEFELDWNEKELDYFDWLLKYIGKDADHASDAIANLSKQMGIYEESIDWAKKGIADIFDLHGVDFDFDNADPNYLYDRLLDFMHLQGLESEMTEKEAEALIDYMDVLRDSYDGMYDAWEEAHEHMMNAWDEWNERIGDAIYDIQQYGEELENIQKIVDLTGRKLLKMSTQDLNKMNQTIVVNAQENLRATKAHLDAMEQAVADSAAAYQRSLEQNLAEDVQNKLYEEWRQMKEDYDDALNDYYNAWEDTLQKGEDTFKRYMEALTQDYNNSFGQMDLDYMIDQFDRQKEVRDLYLDDYQKYHELNKTAQELNKSLAATNNELIRGKLLDLQDELNAAMSTGVQISAAQAEIYARRVALLQAEAELLDAQNAKSAVRMTRDNEGNFSYTYTADQEQIGEAQENYGDSFYELLEFERNYMDEIQSDMLAKRKEFMDRLNEISEMYWDDQDAYNQALMDLREEYLAYCDYYVGEQEMDLYEMERLRDEDWMDFQDITGLKLAEHDDFITFFKNTIYGDLANAYDTARQDGLNWQGVMQATTAMATQAVNNYQTNTKRTYEMAGQNIDTYATKVENDFDDIVDKSSDTADAVDDMGKDMATTMSDIQSNAWNLDSAWGTVMDSMRNQISQTVSALQTLLQKLQEVQSQAQATIAAVQAAAMASASAGFGGGWAGGGGGSGGGSGSGSGGGSGGGAGPGGTDIWTVKNDAGDPVFTTTNKSEAQRWANSHNAAVTSQAGGAHGQDSMWWVSQGYRTGGYTGAWGSEGKLAVLHEKELVLNKDDTSNMLSMVNIVRGIVDTIGSNGMLNTLALAAGGATGLVGGLGAGLEQQVHIEANFPNVQSHTEIETALNNLINSASQYVNRKS